MTKVWLASVAAIVLTLGGCEYLNATAGVEPPPAEGRPFPNLASVPRPPPTGPAAERRAEVDRLTAARDASIREDQAIRSITPGWTLPPPRQRIVPTRQPTGPAAAPSPAPAEPTAPAETAAPTETAAPEQRPREEPRVAMPRPQLPRSLFMGTVVPAAERGPLADFQRRVLQDSAAMAQRANGRIRLVGGRSAEERQGIVNELTAMGVAAGRISAVPDEAAANRAGIDVLVEN